MKLRIFGTAIAIFLSSLTIRAEVSEVNYEKVLNRLQATFAKDIHDLGYKLIFERRYSDGTVNATVRKFGDKIIVTLFGGIAQHKGIDEDALALVGCHEIGYFLGGAPAQNKTMSMFAQADYWASAKCMKRYLYGLDNQDVVSKGGVDPVAKAFCQLIFSDLEKQAVCIRTAHASLKLASVLAILRGENEKDLSLGTPDDTVVEKTNGSWPTTQCRLDNSFQGALCDKDPFSKTSLENPKEGFCNRSEGYSMGVRPLCWYKP